MSAIIGDIQIPGDKSISHRAIILSSIMQATTDIHNILLSDDIYSTICVMRELGVNISVNAHQHSACVEGVGLRGLKSPTKKLDCGNSGTTIRLLCGLLCAQSFNSTLIGDESLSKRPMLRVAEPLRLMNAKINLSENNTAPISIAGNQTLTPLNYELLIPSAQVKSAILLAGLYTHDKTIVREPVKTRDHTERLLAFFKDFAVKTEESQRAPIKIPGDISSAAFFMVAAALTPGSDLTIHEVGVNPFRVGMIEILKLMGANIILSHHQMFGLEPVADIRIQYAPLNGISIPQELISTAIDELPVILVAAVTAKGNTLLRGASELRVKESDRIASMIKNFTALNIKTEEYEDGALIYGDQTFQGGTVNSFDDHRIAMAFLIANCVAKNKISVDNCASIKTSFPNFMELAQHLNIIKSSE